MNKFRILHLGKYYPPYSGGMETHLRDLAVRQALIGAVSVIVANDKPEKNVSTVDGVDIIRVARFGSVASMPICPTLPWAINSCPSELVHLHMPNPGSALAFLLSGHKGRLIITHHSDTLGRRVLRKISQLFITATMKRASAIIVTSQRYLESSRELAPYREKCHIIPLGIETDELAAVDIRAANEVRSLYGNKIVLAIGRLVSYKGFDILVRSMKDVDGKLLIIGSGPQESEIREIIMCEGLSSRVFMLGNVEDLRPYYQAASIFVLPSINRAEAFGLVQLEAMICGLPVINTAVESGVPELSIDGVTGLTVPPNDVTALGDAIKLLLSSEALRQRFARAARLRVIQEFTADQMASRVQSLYQKTMSNHPR